jgi:hypothetical protein
MPVITGHECVSLSLRNGKSIDEFGYTVQRSMDQCVVFSATQMQKPRPLGGRGFLTEPEAGSVADVDRPHAETERGRHGPHHIAAVIIPIADISDAEAVPMAEMTEVVAVMTSAVTSTVPTAMPVRRSGGRSQRHCAEGSCGNKSKGNFT